MSLRYEVLRTYKQIARIASAWPKYKAQSIYQSIKITPMSKTANTSGGVGGEANEREIEDERRYIVSEARALFRLNKNVSDEEQIREHLKEAKARIELALYYGLPYPRLSNVASGALAKTKKNKSHDLKLQSRLDAQSKPIYLKSYDDKEPPREAPQ